MALVQDCVQRDGFDWDWFEVKAKELLEKYESEAHYLYCEKD